MKRTLAVLAMAVIPFVASAQIHIRQSQARTAESEFGLMTAPVIAELGDISKKRINFTLNFSLDGYKNHSEVQKDLDSFKRDTMAEYCIENNYDIILNPLFEISTNEKGDVLSVTLVGYPARFTGFRPATEADTWMLRFKGVENAKASDDVLDTNQSPTENKKR